MHPPLVTNSVLEEKMKKITNLLLCITLCWMLCIPSAATGFSAPKLSENDIGFSSSEPSPAEEEKPPAEPETPAEPAPAPEKTEDPVEPGPSAPSGGGGYASPIVNIDAIEVPLDDGTSIVLPFLDVPQDAYYTEAVAWAYSNEITGGVADDRFDPLATCTRSQMVTFLWRAAGCPEPTGTASGFSDVAAGSWYEKAVAWAVENKITDGVGDGRFDPNGIVNRAQAVTFLYRAAGAPETTASESFTDVGSGEFYTDAVAWAVANDVTNGVGDNAFAPNANCVRGQTVTFLYRAYK